MSTTATAATATTTTTNSATLTTVSLVNLIGILVSVVLVLMYMIFSGHAMKYIKTFACKIKIISNRVEDKNIQLKDYNYQPQRLQVRQTPGYQQMEAVFKNEIKKSRSLQFKNIIGSYMAKYNHVAHYPFRDKLADKVDLLKPKSTFFNLIFVTSICVVWMITILLSAILQNVYTDMSTVALSTFIGLTVVIGAVAAGVNMLQINRLQHLYVLNIKNAFKSEREQYKFIQLEGDQNKLKEFSPDNSWDEAEFQRHLEEMQQTKSGKDGDSRQFSQSTLGAGLITSRTMSKDENMTMHTSRKLLLTTEDNDRNNTLKKNFNVPNKNVIMEDNEGEEYEYEEPAYSQHSAIKLRSPHQSQDYVSYHIKETPSKFGGKNNKTKGGKFDLNAEARSMESKYDKFAFIEDTHAIGEKQLLSNEALKGENKANVLTFGFIFLIIAVACITCCYLNYTFPALLSKYIFFMSIGAFLVDMLAFRMLAILLMAAIKYLVAKKRGYKNVPYKKPQEIKQLLGTALKDMLIKTPNSKQSINPNHDPRLKNKQQQISADAMDYEDQTQGQYERHDTTMKNFNMEEQKEDEYAQEIDENGFKKTDHFGPAFRIPHQESYISNNPLLKNGELSENTLKQTHGGPQHTQFSLLKSLQPNTGKSEREHEQLMDRKQIVNELADYNLMLFRMIYDAYDERGERVIRKFRSDDHAVLRKRFMTPILNPNFDHDEWLKDQMKNKVIEEVGGEFEDQLPGEQDFSGKDSNKIEPTTQELADDPKANKVERLYIDKFGNLLSDKPSELMIVLPQPAYGKIEEEREHQTEDEHADEWSKKLKELEMLRAKKQRGETLTNQESKRLTELETEEDLHRHKEIEDLEALGSKKSDEQNSNLKKLLKEEQDYRNRRIEELLNKEKKHKLNEEEKKELNMLQEWQKEQKKKLLDELREKKKNGQLTEEEEMLLRQLEEEEKNAKKSELEELREKLKRGTITEEERKRLQQLEEEEINSKKSELEELMAKLKNGTITEEERKRLQELQEWEKNFKKNQLDELRQKLKDGTLTEEEKKLLQQLEDEQYRASLSELEMLRLKKERGELTEEEKRRLEELEEWQHKERMSEIENLQNKKNKTAEEIAQLKHLLEQEDIRVNNQLNDLYEKMARGEQLTDEELRKLKELEDYKQKRLVSQIEELLELGENISDEDKLKLLFLQRELLKLELDQLRRKNPPLSEEDQARLKLLEENLDKLDLEYLLMKQKLGTLTSEELERLRELEAKLKMNDLSHIQGVGEDSQLFEEDEMLNGDQALHNKANEEDEESYFKTEEAESRITDNDNFADLPPVEVIGSIKKPPPKSSESQRQKMVEKLNEEERHTENVEKHNENYEFKQEDKVGQEKKQASSEMVQEKTEEQANTQRSQISNSKKEVQFKQVESQENQQTQKHDQLNSSNKRKHSCSEYGLNEGEKLLQKGEDGYDEQQERIQTAKTGLRDGEKKLSEGDKGYEEQQERIKTAQAKYRDHLQHEEDRLGLKEGEKLLQPNEPGYAEQQERMRTAQQNGGLRDGEKLLEKGEKGYEEQQERIKASQEYHHDHDDNSNDQLNKSQQNSSRTGLCEGEKLLKKGEKGYEEQQSRINSATKQQQQSIADQERINQSVSEQNQSVNDNSTSQIKQQLSSSSMLQQNNLEQLNEEQQRQLSSRQLERLQSAKSRQSMQNRSNHMLNSSGSLQQNETGLRDGEKMLSKGEKGYEAQQERIKSAISQQRANLQSALSGLRDGERLLSPGEPGYEEQQQRMQMSHRSDKKDIMSEQERIKSAISGNRSQARLDSEGNMNMTSNSEMEKRRHHAAGMENYDRVNGDDMMEFGHDDLEMAGVPAPPHGDGQMAPDESIYSHKTSTILDEEKVSFMHIEHLPDQDNASDDSFAEQDMVYYNKDDLTNYSKGLGLNKVKAKPTLPQYYSENDIQEVSENGGHGNGSFSDADEGMAADESRSWDPRRKKMGGRGKIQHNDLEVQSYNDQIDGRLKVDSWNLNYNGKKKKLRKRKIDESVQRRMDALQGIYGVDAKSLAGINRVRPTAPLISGANKSKDGGNLGTSRISDNMSFRSTQNSMFKPNATKNNLHRGSNKDSSAMELNSNMFSSNGFTNKPGMGMGMSKRWNDIESTLKGGKVGSGMPPGRTLNNAARDNNRSQNYKQQQISPSANAKQNKMFGTNGQKLTQTQQKFNMNDPYSMQEESKSRSNSNNNRNMQSQNLQKGNKKSLNKKNSQGYDNYSESDEGVSDSGAMFQKRNAPPASQAWAKDKPSPAGAFKNQNQGSKKNNKNKETIIDNEIDHDESDEGVNDNDPNFEGNNPLFQRRDFDLSHQVNQKKHKTLKMNKNGSTLTGNNKGGVFARNSSQGSDLEKGFHGRGRAVNTQYGGRNSNLSDGGSKTISPTKPPLSGAMGRQHSNGNLNQNKNTLGTGRGSYDANNNNNNNASQRKNARNRSNGFSDNGGAINKRGGKNINNGGRGAGSDEDDDDQFIVGPESNHSMIQSRNNFNKNKKGSLDDQNVGYLSMHNQTSQQRQGGANYNSTQSPDQKRKVRRAAHSTSDADREYNRLQTLRNERLKKSQMQAEGALFNKTGESDGSGNGMLARKKKKRQAKDSVRKEVNYWLDYDSPYAEYLVARFREWSPNVKPLHSAKPGEVSDRNNSTGKYKEIQNVYAGTQDSRHNLSSAHKKHSSVSPNKDMNMTANSLGHESAQVLGNKKSKRSKVSQRKVSQQQQQTIPKGDPSQISQTNHLYFHEVEDYEEEP